MASKLAVLVFAVALCAILAMQGGVSAKRVRCFNPYYRHCFGQSRLCPYGCPNNCRMICRLCKAVCPCDQPGGYCGDPRFVGGDGIMFYFHGHKDKDFCLVSDSALHINGHFIGKSRGGTTRDFTWVQALGVMFDSHQLYLGANKVGKWDDSADELSLKLDGQDVVLPPGEGSTWEAPSASGLHITRFKDTNAVTVEVPKIFKITALAVPITEEESRIHKYNITEDDCFAHLEVNFKFYGLSGEVDGVLGQTYAPGFKTPVNIGIAMPTMGGDHKYSSSHLFATDCQVARFRAGEGAALESLELTDLKAISCGSGDAAGQGMVCRR